MTTLRGGFHVRCGLVPLRRLSIGARVVIEVDGQHHFSRDDKRSLAAYAEMVLADRDLRLSGYKIFCFGANEFVWTTASSLVESFFDRLFQLNIIATFQRTELRTCPNRSAATACAKSVMVSSSRVHDRIRVFPAG